MTLKSQQLLHVDGSSKQNFKDMQKWNRRPKPALRLITSYNEVKLNRTKLLSSGIWAINYLHCADCLRRLFVAYKQLYKILHTYICLDSIFDLWYSILSNKVCLIGFENDIFLWGTHLETFHLLFCQKWSWRKSILMHEQRARHYEVAVDLTWEYKLFLKLGH